MTLNKCTLLQRFLLLVTLISTGSIAQSALFDEGIILQINPAFINLSDNRFDLLATTKVQRQPGNKKMSLQALKPGDAVNIKLIKIGKKYFVDTINLLPNSDEIGKNERSARP